MVAAISATVFTFKHMGKETYKSSRLPDYKYKKVTHTKKDYSAALNFCYSSNRGGGGGIFFFLGGGGQTFNLRM